MNEHHAFISLWREEEKTPLFENGRLVLTINRDKAAEPAPARASIHSICLTSVLLSYHSRQGRFTCLNIQGTHKRPFLSLIYNSLRQINFLDWIPSHIN